MSGIGGKHQTWSHELDKKLLTEIRNCKGQTALSISMQMSTTKIRARLKEMGFDGIKDAINVMSY